MVSKTKQNNFAVLTLSAFGIFLKPITMHKIVSGPCGHAGGVWAGSVRENKKGG